MYYRDSVKMAAESHFTRVNTERSSESRGCTEQVATPAVEVVRQRAMQAAEYYHKKVRTGSVSSGSGTDMAAGGDTYQMNSHPGGSTPGKQSLDSSDASETDALRAGVTPASSDTYYKQKLRAGFIDLRNSYNEKIRTRGSGNLGHRTFTAPANFEQPTNVGARLTRSQQSQNSGSPGRRKQSGDRGHGLAQRATRSERRGLHRSNSSLELEHGQQDFLPEDAVVPVGMLRRDYGSANSLDVMSNSGESFFAMLQDYHNENLDQRAAAPPRINELLRGRVDLNKNTTPASGQVQNRVSYPQMKPALNGTAVAVSDSSIDPSSSPKMGTKLQQKNKERKPRAKTMVAEASSGILRKIRGARSDTESGNKSMSDNSLDDGRPEDRQKRKAFLHFDCQSIGVVLGDVMKRRTTVEITRRNTTTGASAASGTRGTDTDDPVTDDTDAGDGKSSELLLSCPFFRNEIGGEEEHMICLNRVTAQKRSRQLQGGRERGAESVLRPAMCNGITILDTSKNVQGVSIPAVVSYRGLVVEHVDHGAAYYRTFFHGFDHQNLFGIDDNLGPVAVSIKREKVLEEEWDREGAKTEGGGTTGYFQYRIIVRTPELTTLRGCVAEDVIPSTSRLSNTRGLPAKEILDFVVPDLNTACLRQALTGTKTCEQLMKVDEQGVTKNYKIGVMYCREGQSSEEEMYNNEWPSPVFEEFLHCIGKKVLLKDFDQYRGGLDCKTDSTGNHSLYTDFHGYGIMFHVSTMLPYTPSNRQQLLRKRHIGNDIVTIVFQEPGAEPFTPKTVRSHFQHVFIIVRSHNPNTENVKYSIAVSRSKDVPTFGPAIPEGAVFTNSAEFKEFLLTKAINAENAVHKSEKFTAMAIRTRQEYLKDLATNFVTTSSLDSGSKFGKFSLGSGRKKEKIKSRSIPDTFARGGLIWSVQVDDFGRTCTVKCFLAIGAEMIVVLDDTTKEVIFTTTCKSVIGWTAQSSSLRLYYDQGECIVLRTYQSDVDEIQEIVKRMTVVTDGCRTTEMTLRRNDVGQLGFHIHYDGIVSDVEPYGFAWKAGLKQGSRLVEICKVATATLSHDQMIDLLRTSVPVTVVVIPPFDDGTPRRGFEDQWPTYSPYTSRYAPATTTDHFSPHEEEPPVPLPPRAGRTPGFHASNRGELQHTSLSRYRPARHDTDLKGVTVNLEAHFSQLTLPSHAVQSSQESIVSRSSGQGSEHLSSEGHKPDDYVSMDEEPVTGRAGMKDYEAVVNPNWSGRVTIYPAYSKDSQLSHGSQSPRSDSNHWYDQPPTNPPPPNHNPPIPDRFGSSYHSHGGGYLSQHQFTPMTRKAVSNSSLASPHPYSVYHSDTETRSTRHDPDPSSLTSLGPFTEWSARNAGNSSKRTCRGMDQRDETPVSRYRPEALSPAGRRRQLAFSIHKNKRQDAVSPQGSSGSSPGSSLKRGVTAAVSDENISGRHHAGKSGGDASSHRHNDMAVKSSNFQEELMRLINPDFSDKDRPRKGDVPLTRTSASTNSHRKFRGRPSRLQRTLSDESMCGAVASKQYRDPGEGIFTSAIPARSGRGEHFFSDPRLSPRAMTDRSCLRMNGTSRTPASPILPLPDSAGIDWTNLVDAARAFEGSTEAAIKPGSRTNIVESHNSTDLREGSNSHLSDTPHGGHPPPPPMRANASSNKTSGAWRSGTSNPAQRIEELENRLSQVEQELERERSEKSRLQTEVKQLQQDNIELQEESQKAATQLRQFTEWFFNTIDRQ